MRRSLILMLFALLLAVRPAAAAPSFGSGLAVCPPPIFPVTLSSPTVVSGPACTRAGIQAALSQGGQIRLDCGGAPVPIPQTLVLNPNVDTVIDGGGVTTLDGQGAARILFKDWHDPAKHPSVTVTLQNIRLINGKAPAGSNGWGGALMAGYSGTRVHIINSTFENNATTSIHTPDNQGGAVMVHNADELIISGAAFLNNSAGSGGAVGEIAVSELVFNSLFVANHALDDLPDSQIVRGYGGALSLDGVNTASLNTFHVCGSVFDGNTAIRGGGAVDAVFSDGFNTQATFEQSTFRNNSVWGYADTDHPGDFKGGLGGAIYHIEDDRVGASAENNFSIRDSTFANNFARKAGGALWVTILGRGEIWSSTFSANSTLGPNAIFTNGGALGIMDTSVFDIRSTTFADNGANSMGGAIFAGANTTLTNTIFFNNTLNPQNTFLDPQWQGYHTSQTLQDGGQNIQYPRYKPDYPNNDVNNNITASPIYANPKLLALAGNGGPTETMALQTGSPAINAAVEARCPARDQRGYVRQGACDIGAFEFGGSVFNPRDWVFLPLVRH